MGDVYVSTALRNHDRRIELPVFDQYGIWEVTSPPAPRLVEVRVDQFPPQATSAVACDLTRLASQALGLKTGTVSSGNSLNCGPEDRAALDASGACVKEMEGAAIAYVAHLFDTPLLAVKAITDIVDGDKVSGKPRRARVRPRRHEEECMLRCLCRALTHAPPPAASYCALRRCVLRRARLHAARLTPQRARPQRMSLWRTSTLLHGRCNARCPRRGRAGCMARGLQFVGSFCARACHVLGRSSSLWRTRRSQSCKQQDGWALQRQALLGTLARVRVRFEI